MTQLAGGTSHDPMYPPSLRGAYLAAAEARTVSSASSYRSDVLNVETRDRLVIYRVMAALSATQSVLNGTACLTRVGARYLGVRDPARNGQAIWWH